MKVNWFIGNSLLLVVILILGSCGPKRTSSAPAGTPRHRRRQRQHGGRQRATRRAHGSRGTNNRSGATGGGGAAATLPEQPPMPPGAGARGDAGAKPPEGELPQRYYPGSCGTHDFRRPHLIRMCPPRRSFRTLERRQAAWNIKLISSTPPTKDSLGSFHSDLAFSGKMSRFKATTTALKFGTSPNPAKPVLANTYTCPASQNDVSVYRNILFMSSEATNSRQDCKFGRIRNRPAK